MYGSFDGDNSAAVEVESFQSIVDHRIRDEASQPYYLWKKKFHTIKIIEN